MKVWYDVFINNKGSEALKRNLITVHAKNPEFQAFLKKHGINGGSSVTQASKAQTVSPEERKRREDLSNKAYGATTGAKMGGEHGSNDEYKDTIPPLTPKQHASVRAAERAAKETTKKAAPSVEKSKKPAVKKQKAALTKDEIFAAIARAARKNNTGERYEDPTLDPDDVDHEELKDLHHSLHIPHAPIDEASPYGWYGKEAQDQKAQDTVHLAAKHMMRTLRKLPADSAERKGIAKALQGVVGAIKEDVLDEAKGKRDLESFLHKDELPHSHVKAIIKKGKWTPSEGVTPKPGEHITLYNRDHLGRATTSHRLYVYPDADEHKGKVKIGPIEEAEQINELETPTLVSYLSKAGSNVNDHPENEQKRRPKMDKAFAKAVVRPDFQAAASKELRSRTNEEAEQIDEISKRMAFEYLKGKLGNKEIRLVTGKDEIGFDNAVSRLTKGDDSMASRTLKQATNDAAFKLMNKSGIVNAAKKLALAKEEVAQEEMQHSSKPSKYNVFGPKLGSTIRPTTPKPDPKSGVLIHPKPARKLDPSIIDPKPPKPDPKSGAFIHPKPEPNPTGRAFIHPKPAPYKGPAYYDEEVEQIDEISSKLAGEYLAKATKQHMDKVGVRPNMYYRIFKDMGKKRKIGVDRAMDRVLGNRKTNEESTPSVENNSYLNNKKSQLRESVLGKLAAKTGKK